jgi:hypothetical protein
MKYRNFIFLLVCFAWLITGCGNETPLAPDSKELAANDQGISLDKKPCIKITPWEGIEKRINVPNEGKQWVSDDGILHVRGMVFVDEIFSDETKIAGINTVTCDYDLNLTSGSGTYSSKWTLVPHAVAGTWKGRVIGEMTNFLFSGFGIGRGSGVLSGSTMTVDLQTKEPNGDVYESGYIFEKK